jgi:hypothetical protein
VCALLPPAAAQQPMPFMGRGDSAPAAPVDVYVTAYVDRILKVDDRGYEFTVGAALVREGGRGCKEGGGEGGGGGEREGGGTGRGGCHNGMW